MVRHLSIVLSILGVLVLVSSISIAISVHTKAMSPEQGQVYAQINMVLLTVMILLIYYRQTQVLSNQEQIMNKQTKLLEFEKKPMLLFKHENLKSNQIRLTFISISKYPMLIEDVKFELSNNLPKNTQVDVEVIIRFPPEYNYNHPPTDLNGLIGKALVNGSSVSITFNTTEKLTPFGIVKLRVSNQYYREISIEYEYNLESGELKIKENS